MISQDDNLEPGRPTRFARPAIVANHFLRKERTTPIHLTYQTIVPLLDQVILNHLRPRNTLVSTDNENYISGKRFDKGKRRTPRVIRRVRGSRDSKSTSSDQDYEGYNDVPAEPPDSATNSRRSRERVHWVITATLTLFGKRRPIQRKPPMDMIARERLKITPKYR